MHANELARAWGSGDSKHVLPCFILHMLLIRLCNHCFLKKCCSHCTFWLEYSYFLLSVDGSNAVMLLLNLLEGFTTLYLLFEQVTCLLGLEATSSWLAWQTERGDPWVFTHCCLNRAKEWQGWADVPVLRCTVVTGLARVPKANLDSDVLGDMRGQNFVFSCVVLFWTVTRKEVGSRCTILK